MKKQHAELLYMKREKEEGTVVVIVFGKSRQSVIPCLQSVAADTARFWMLSPKKQNEKSPEKTPRIEMLMLVMNP
jgi:hypothetical protein